MKRTIVVGILMVAIFLSRAQPQNNESATPPEIKKTVDAFLGHWVLTAKNTELGAKAPVNFEMTLDCKRAALGAAVTCSFAGKMPGVGPIEASAVMVTTRKKKSFVGWKSHRPVSTTTTEGDGRTMRSSLSRWIIRSLARRRPNICASLFPQAGS